MSQKIVDLPGIGPVILAKRRGAKNLRLSILPNGKVRVSMPLWVPYSAGLEFSRSRADWIIKNTANIDRPLLREGHRIGKSYRLRYVARQKTGTTSARLGINSITITSHLEFSSTAVQQKAAVAAEKALKKEAEVLLSARLNQIARVNGFQFSALKVRRLTSRWGSCSNTKQITLSYYLVQLPWRLIDYVLVHELAHTRHLNHSREFWAQVEAIIPDAKLRRKEIKAYRPILRPF